MFNASFFRDGEWHYYDDEEDDDDFFHQEIDLRNAIMDDDEVVGAYAKAVQGNYWVRLQVKERSVRFKTLVLQD